MSEERRTLDVGELRIEGRTLYGLAAPFNSPSRDLGGVTETYAAGSFSEVLRSEPDVHLVLNHDVNQVLGRTKSGTLRLRETERGLEFNADLPDSPLGQNVREAVRRGDIDGASIRFKVGSEKWEGDHRTVVSVSHLADITVATKGAYEAARVELRSDNNDESPGTQKEQDMSEDREVNEGGLEVEDRTEERTERPSAGSLRVQDRAEAPMFQTLAQAYEDRGFFTNGVASVSFDEYRSFTWSAGTVLTDLNPVRTEGVAFGYDQRWLYPVLPTTAVSDATTAIQYLRQSARTLAGTAVIRPLDAVSTKPETSSTAELQTLQLQQIASVQSNVPRIHAAQSMFQSIVEQDLRLAIGDGLDEVVRRGVVTAGTSAAVTGNIVDKIRKARTVVESNGYMPDTLAIDPSGAETLDLLKTSGPELMYVFAPGQAAPAPWGLRMRIWKSPGTAILDSSAFGRLYVSPMELRSFEADGGLTNKTNVRLETNAGYSVERLTAGLRIL